MDEEGRRQPGRGVDRLTIQEAARRLGVSEGAIRKRVTRNTLRHEKEADGRIYVYLDKVVDDGVDPGVDARPEDEPSALISRLEDEVDYLRGVIATKDRQLDTRAEELRRRAEEARRRDEAFAQQQQLTAYFAERVRELEAPEEAEEVHEDPDLVEATESSAPPPDAPKGAEGAAESAPGTQYWPGGVEAQNDPERAEQYGRRMSDEYGRRSTDLGGAPGTRPSWWRRLFGG